MNSLSCHRETFFLHLRREKIVEYLTPLTRISVFMMAVRARAFDLNSNIYTRAAFLKSAICWRVYWIINFHSKNNRKSFVASACIYASVRERGR